MRYKSSKWKKNIIITYQHNTMGIDITDLSEIINLLTSAMELLFESGFNKKTLVKLLMVISSDRYSDTEFDDVLMPGLSAKINQAGNEPQDRRFLDQMFVIRKLFRKDLLIFKNRFSNIFMIATSNGLLNEHQELIKSIIQIHIQHDLLKNIDLYVVQVEPVPQWTLQKQL